MKKTAKLNEKVFLWVLFVMDIIGIVFFWRLSYLIRDQFFTAISGSLEPINAWEYYYLFLPIVVICCMLLNSAYHLYRHYHMNSFLVFSRSFKIWLYTMILLFAASGIFRELSIGRSIIFIFSASYGVYTYISRFLVRWFKIYLIHQGLLCHPIIIVGSGKLAKETADMLKNVEDIDYQISGFVKEHEKTVPTIDKNLFIGVIHHLPKLVREKQIQEIIFASEEIYHEDLLSIIVKYEHLGVSFKIVSNLFEVITDQVKLDNVSELPLIELPNAQESFLYNSLKRLIDLLITIPAFILSTPLFLGILAILHFKEEGSAVFTQERVGKKGKTFTLYKFRTMSSSSNPYEEAPFDEKDNRITPIGKWLRKTSLDELPQLLNVLKGDMSLVGPRPEMPFIVEQYQPWQKKRLDVKPGLTGLWQVVGRKKLPLQLNLEYDFYYIKHRSVFFDILIILKTIPAVLFGRGAY